MITLTVGGHPEADEELDAAALWYEERQPGLSGTIQFSGPAGRVVVLKPQDCLDVALNLLLPFPAYEAVA